VRSPPAQVCLSNTGSPSGRRRIRHCQSWDWHLWRGHVQTRAHHEGMLSPTRTTNQPPTKNAAQSLSFQSSCPESSLFTDSSCPFSSHLHVCLPSFASHSMAITIFEYSKPNTAIPPLCGIRSPWRGPRVWVDRLICGVCDWVCWGLRAYISLKCRLTN
jgi:hypothetical protein